MYSVYDTNHHNFKTQIWSYPFSALLFQIQATHSVLFLKSKNKLLLLPFILLSFPSEFIK